MTTTGKCAVVGVAFNARISLIPNCAEDPRDDRITSPVPDHDGGRPDVGSGHGQGLHTEAAEAMGGHYRPAACRRQRPWEVPAYASFTCRASGWAPPNDSNDRLTPPRSSCTRCVCMSNCHNLERHLMPSPYQGRNKPLRRVSAPKIFFASRFTTSALMAPNGGGTHYR